MNAARDRVVEQTFLHGNELAYGAHGLTYHFRTISGQAWYENPSAQPIESMWIEDGAVRWALQQIRPDEPCLDSNRQGFPHGFVLSLDRRTIVLWPTPNGPYNVGFVTRQPTVQEDLIDTTRRAFLPRMQYMLFPWSDMGMATTKATAALPA